MLRFSSDAGLFDLIDGIPVHVLVIHAVVVFVPLSALLVTAVVIFPRLRSHYRFPVVGLAVLSGILTVIAEQSGKALQRRVGYVGQHAELGSALTPVVLIFGFLSVCWLILTSMKSEKLKLWLAIAGGAVIAAGLIALVLTFFVGHSGARSAWSDRVEPSSSEEDALAPTSQQGEADSASSDRDSADSQFLDLGAVALRNTEENCWTVIGTQVYDLTDWIAQHPGGASRIIPLCGIDGTVQFEGRHGGSAGPEAALERFLVGTLGDQNPFYSAE